MHNFIEWSITGLILASAAGISLWIAGAIYFDLGLKAQWNRLLAVFWIGSVVLLFALWQPIWQPFIVLVISGCIFFGWWLQKKPSHDREWDASVAVLPRAVRQDDVVTIENIRNFEYRSLTDFTPRYETRTYHLSNLKAADIIFFNWGSKWMSHPVMVFDFGPDGRICGSIEVRYRQGQNYAILRSLYRQQELIFLVADERDVILRRTKYSGNQIGHLYRFHASDEELRTVFLDYVDAINGLYEKPRWYNGLCANCTTSFYRLPNSRFRFDWRVLANSRLDRALYEDGKLDRSRTFEELHRFAVINDIANTAPEIGFGDHLRREMESRRHER